MPVTELIGELEKRKGLTVNQAHKVLRECNLPSTGEITDADRDRVLAHVDNPKPKDLAPKSSDQGQEQEKGPLTKAHEGIVKTAVQSSKKQMVAVADRAAREGAVAFATRSAQNLEALTLEIAGITDTATKIYEATEGTDDDDPLASPPLSFGLT